MSPQTETRSLYEHEIENERNLDKIRWSGLACVNSG